MRTVTNRADALRAYAHLGEFTAVAHCAGKHWRCGVHVQTAWARPPFVAQAGVRWRESGRDGIEVGWLSEVAVGSSQRSAPVTCPRGSVEIEKYLLITPDCANTRARHLLWLVISFGQLRRQSERRSALSDLGACPCWLFRFATHCCRLPALVEDRTAQRGRLLFY